MTPDKQYVVSFLLLGVKNHGSIVLYFGNCYHLLVCVCV